MRGGGRKWMAVAVQVADAILTIAQEHDGVVSMAQERAAYGEWPALETPADSLFWIEDEEQLQRDQAEACPEEAEERGPYADLLHHYAALLRLAGVRPSRPVSYQYIREHLLNWLEALSARFRGGEDLGLIFDGCDLFHELAQEVRALDRARSKEDVATRAGACWAFSLGPALWDEVEMRKKLERLDGQRARFRATIECFGEKPAYRGGTQKTILLRDVTQVATGQVVTSHLWFTFTRRWQDAGVQTGDVVEFDARVKEYRKGYWGRDWQRQIENPPRWDYKLTYPTKIERLEPEGECQAQELASLDQKMAEEA